MAKIKGQKHKLSIISYKIVKGSLLRVEKDKTYFCTKVTSIEQALDYIQQTNFDIAYLEE